MPKFAANLTTMYQELEVPERFAAASASGFQAVEFLAPYAFESSEISSWLADQQLELILINTPSGLPGEREVGLAAIPGREADFRDTFLQALGYAHDLGTGLIHVLGGRISDRDRLACEKALCDNLVWAAAQAAEKEITLLLEPLNEVDVPGYVYTSSDQAANIIRKVGAPNLKMQYDFYHMQIMEGHLAAHLERHWDLIGHIQFSSVPGRHEPQYGEVNLPFLFNFLDNRGYPGWIGCEYFAKTTTPEGLTWASPYGIQAL